MNRSIQKKYYLKGVYFVGHRLYNNDFDYDDEFDNIDMVLKQEFINLKHLERGLMIRLVVEKDPDNISALREELEYTRECMQEEMNYWGIKVGADRPSMYR